MIELHQFAWSPFCIVIRRILEFGRIPHRVVNVSPEDRSSVWRMTRQRYYHLPVIRCGREVLFETDENSQVIAKYLNGKFELGLFPEEYRGLQSILWQRIESDVEGITFKLNDVYFEEFVRKADRLGFIRHKERKFGAGCLVRWREQQPALLDELSVVLLPFDQMLLTRPFLLCERPLFVDFDLYGMLATFHYSGHYKFPPAHPRLNEWFQRMQRIKCVVSK